MHNLHYTEFKQFGDIVNKSILNLNKGDFMMCNKKCCLLDKMTGKEAVTLISKVEKPFKDLPHLPQSLIDFFVTITPWGIGLGGFFSITGAITNLRFGLGMNPISKFVGFYTGINPLYFFLTAALQLITAMIAFKAFSLLRERKINGWIYLFWSNVIALLSSIVGFIFLGGSGVGLLIGALIGYYFLFEIKPAYEVKKEKTIAKKTRLMAKPEKVPWGKK